MAKRQWCCTEKSLGCGDDGKPLPFDCHAGRENWREGWSDDKKHWQGHSDAFQVFCTCPCSGHRTCLQKVMSE
eukprot:symbB.v1.2.008456.t1/scaffold429.1/size206233/12